MGIPDPMSGISRMENEHNATLPKQGGETRRPKPKKNKPKQRLYR